MNMDAARHFRIPLIFVRFASSAARALASLNIYIADIAQLIFADVECIAMHGIQDQPSVEQDNEQPASTSSSDAPTHMEPAVEDDHTLDLELHTQVRQKKMCCGTKRTVR
ncbi:hypothetical protein BC832DRAFT_543284 [Gaertneriomyces semiglobifer]|nr:hypothetical protein BC832DRAFT_543284 [Gaertneriomyces semiglobifer]